MKEETINETSEKHVETRQDVLISVGNTLKNKRLDASISISDIANQLNIRLDYLEALEAGDWSVMPEEVYAIGFLRQYAKHLQCDLSESIEKLKTNDYTLNKPITFPDPPVAPNRKWMLISLFALIVLFIAFNVIKQQASSPLPSEILKTNAQHVMDQQVEATPKQVMKSKEVIDSSSNKADKPSPTPKNAATKAVPSAPLASNTQEKNSHTHNIPTKKTDKPLPASAQTASNEMHAYRFTARSSDVWLQIYTKNDEKTPLREALLKQGQSLSISSNQALSVTTGKPLSLEISMDNQIIVPVGSMAKKNHVVRHFLLGLSVP